MEIKIKIIEDFYRIIKYDNKHSKYPEPIGYFCDEKEKERFIKRHMLAEDFVWYLGNIFSNYHMYILKDHKTIPFIEGTFNNKVIKYDEIYRRALNEYCATLFGNRIADFIQMPQSYETNNDHAYGTTFILPALIERFLIIQIKAKLIHDSINKITELKKSGRIRLNKEEGKLYNTFIIMGNKVFFQDYRIDLYNLLTKNNIINDDKDMKLLILDKNEERKLALGSLIQSEYVKSIVKKPYMKLLHTLFDKDQLNIRNNIMHANNDNIDYHTIGITSVMMQLLWDIMKNEIFK